MKVSCTECADCETTEVVSVSECCEKEQPVALRVVKFGTIEMGILPFRQMYQRCVDILTPGKVVERRDLKHFSADENAAADFYHRNCMYLERKNTAEQKRRKSLAQN